MSCDDLHEKIAAPLYHDSIALGWQSFFENDYDLALDWFNTAFEATDESYHNSAHVGIGWTYLFLSNLSIGDSTLVEEYRDLAKTEFDFVDNEQEAIESYSDNCQHTYCCDDCFSKDRKLGFLIYELETKFKDKKLYNNEIQDLVEQLRDFVNNNSNYNFMDGKAPGMNGEIVKLGKDNVILYLAQIYLRNNQLYESCEILRGTNLECQDDCNNIEIDIFLDCDENHSPI